MYANRFETVIDMLFANKTKPTLSECVIREELTDPTYGVLVRVNLRYPEIKLKNRDPLMRNAAPFYLRTAQSFLACVKKELFPIALEDRKNGSAEPYAAVMRWEKTFEDDKYLSVFLDVSIYDGKTVRPPERQTQVWEKKFGLKCGFSYFFTPEAKMPIRIAVCGTDDKMKFEREIFTLREGGFEFYRRNENGTVPVFLPFGFLNEKKLLKITV